MKELDFATANNTNYLYTTEYNLVDFNVDDNGLWVIYSTMNSNHTIVSMLNPMTLEAIYSLNISINHHKVIVTVEPVTGKINYFLFCLLLMSGGRDVHRVRCFVCHRFYHRTKHENQIGVGLVHHEAFRRDVKLHKSLQENDNGWLQSQK